MPQPPGVQKTEVQGTLPHPLALPFFVALPRCFLSLSGNVIDILFRAGHQVFFFPYFTRFAQMGFRKLSDFFQVGGLFGWNITTVLSFSKNDG